MKQTNNALKFLLALYRAIFKNAYFKGLASAVIVTAGLGLAAGQAQAVHFVELNPVGSTWVEKYQYQHSTVASIAGEVEVNDQHNNEYASDDVFDGNISDAVLNVGASGAGIDVDVGSIIGLDGVFIAAGAYIKIEDAPSISNAVADHNILNLKSGGSITGSAYGAYVSIDVGNVTATDNELNIGDNVTIATSTTGTLYGAYIDTDGGTARAENNSVTINASTFTVNSGSDIIGAMVMGSDGASAVGNTITISGTGTTQLSLGGIKYLRGADVQNGKYDFGSDIQAVDNSVTVTNVAMTSDAEVVIFGGRTNNAGNMSDANKGAVSASGVARGNTVSLTNTTVSGGNNDYFIIGNYAVGQGKDPQGGISVFNQDVTVEGSSDKASVTIEGGSYSTKRSTKDNTIANSMVAGGYAYTVAGDLTARNNSVEVSDNATFNGVNLVGAAAVGGGGGATDSTATHTLTSNKVTLTDATVTPLDGDRSYVVGAYSQLDVSRNVTSVLSDNVVTINSTDDKQQKRYSADVYGAMQKFGVADITKKFDLTAKGNAVNITSNTNIAGNVYGLSSDLTVSAGEQNPAVALVANVADNKVTFGGTMGNASDGAHEIVGAQVLMRAGNSGDVVTTFTNNSVEVTADAVLTNTNLYAVKNTANSDGATTPKDENKVIHSGNTVIVAGTLIYDNGSYEWAGDDIQVKDNAVVHIKNGSTLSLSGLKNTAQDGYFNGTGSVAASAKIANAGTLNVYNALKIEGEDSLFAAKKGALVSVNAGLYAKEGKDVASVTDEKATLYISQTALANYLTTENKTYKLYDNQTVTDAAGALEVVSGGTVDFGTTVTLNDFDFASGTGATAEAGKINVSNTSLTGGSGAYFRADTVNLEHALVTDNSKLTADLSNLATYKFDDSKTKGIGIEANVLNLGSTSLSSTQSEELTFGKATVKDEINFIVATGKDVDTNGNQLNFNNDGFHLTSEVVGSTYMETNDQVSNLEYYTALSGDINGDVIIKATSDDSGSLTLQNGNWTAHDTITVASGGTLAVGGDDGITKPNGVWSSPDATLLTNGVVLDVYDTTAGGTATIKATGDDSSLYNSDEDLIGDQRYVALDLRQGLTMQGDDKGNINGKATITASSGGVILFNADDVNDILAQNHATGVNNTSGATFAADHGGLLYVEGDINARFTDFGDGTNNGFDLSGGNSIYDAGILAANKLTLTHSNETGTGTGSEHDDAAYIGGTNNTVTLGGTVIVNDLVINDEQQTSGKDKPDSSNPYASQVVLANGTAVISQSLSSINNTLVLGTENSGAGLVFESSLRTDTGAIAVDNINVVSGAIAVNNGVWTGTDTTINLSGANTSLTVGGNDSDDQDDDYTASLTAAGLVMGAGTSFAVNANGEATFNTADLTDLDTTAGGISVAGVLTINGASVSGDTTNGVHFGDEASITIENNGELHFGSLATNGAILASGKSYTGTTLTLNTGYSKIENLGGTLFLGFETGTTFDKDAILALKDALFTSNSFTSDKMLIDGGLLNIGNADFAGLDINTEYVGSETVHRDGWTVNWDDIKQYADIYSEINDVTNTKKNQTNIHNIDINDPITGSWGSLSISTGSDYDGAAVTIAGNTWLHYAAGNNGFFVSNDASTAARGATVESQKDLYLIGGGEIGAVTLKQGSDDAEKNLTTLQISGGPTTIAAINTSEVGNATNTRGTQVNVLSDTTVTGNINDADYVSVSDGATLQVNGDASLYNLEVVNATANFAQNLTVDAIDNGGDNDGELLAIGGTIKANDIDLVNDAGINAIDGGTITANTVTVNSTNSLESVIQVGYDLDYLNVSLPEGTDTGTGYLEIADYLELNGATLVVDPAYSEATSVAAIMNFKDGRDTNYQNVVNNVGILNGKTLIGKNAALGVGATLEETMAAISTFQSNGSLSASDYGSILYLNGQLTIADGSELALNADANVKNREEIRNSLIYTITSNVTDQYADLGLGANTAILMTEQAFEDANGDKTGTAISFATNKAVVNANGGEIVLVGTFDASNPLNFFNDASNDGVEILQANGSDGTIKVYTQNGFLFATLDNTNKGLGVQLHVDEDAAYSVMYEASDPVIDSLITYHEGRIAPTTSTEPPLQENPAAEPDPQANGGVEDQVTEPPVIETPTSVAGSSDFLNEVVANSHGAPAEAAARLAIYGGTAQAALGASSTTTDAIASRLGVGSAAGLTVANNGQGAALWVAPVYKSHDSDSFDSQGLDYGVDLNLYGVALGADLEIIPGFTAGLMFNVGSGDADGQGNTAADNTSNDFDYWGAALYGSYRYDALTVAADLSYTTVDNDLEATTGMAKYGKLESSADSTAISFGVTAKYAFDFNSVEVAPHAGLRYTNVDLDDYTVTSNGEDVAHFDASSISVFSVPVGVTIAKEFQGDNWSVKPMFDLTLTGNFGDDEVDGTVSWTGVDNLATSVSSEVLDNFTYGATLGVEAKTGSFSFGLGVNYTGSSNVDEYGVNANARFVF